MKDLLRVGVAALFVSMPAAAQEHQHTAPGEPAQHDPAAPETPQPHYSSDARPSLFAAREASGTAWLPETTPMYGFHGQMRDWQVMLHGNAFVQFLHEAAPEHRGATQAGSINWAMAMARRPFARGWFGVRTMMSLEPVTISGCGYPNLLATGELCNGDNIHDKQHPHDLVMEAAAEFDRPLTGDVRWQVYAGLAGEPALGPAGFPHRLSAMANPISPIIHHWVDSTHITFGVVTAGVYNSRWKAEASIFNGREPDENRYDLDFGPLDSVSGRVSLMAAPSVALQVSAGRLTEGEASHPGMAALHVIRLTGSATYHRGFDSRSILATTFAWGANRELGATTHGWLIETTASLEDRHAWFGRLELNGKPAHDLHIHESTAVFTVAKLQGGYTRYRAPRHGLQPGVGATLSAAFVPDALRPRYGGVGVGTGVFLTIRAATHEMTQ